MDALVVGTEFLGLTVDGAQGSLDTVLFTFKQVEWDGIGVVRLQESLLLSFEFVPLEPELALFLLGITPAGGELHSEHRLGILSKLGGHPLLDVVVELLDAILDRVDQHGLLLASILSSVPTRADEVRVELTGLGSGHLHDQSRSAAAAVDGALEEVVVDFSSLPEPARGQNCLNDLPRFEVDERLMASRITGSLEPNDARVVRVGQDLMQRPFIERLARHVRCLQSSEAACRQSIGDLRETPFAGGVFSKRPGQVLCSLGVWHNRAGLSPV